MLSKFDDVRRSEEGQSLVLACMAMLLLALCVMSTVNLGRHIHQRIALQNTADASAYSMAALEARAFNFYAFSNRAQVVHYVSAMAWQSYLSFLNYFQALMVEVLGLLETINQLNGGSDKCIKLVKTIVTKIPVIGQIIEAILQAINAVTQAVRALVQGVNAIMDVFDMFVGQVIVPGLQLLNQAMFGLQKMMKTALMSDLFNYPEIITKNDQVVQSGTFGTALGTGNALMFRTSHDGASEGLPDANFDGQQVGSTKTQAKRGMSEVANATRYNNFLTKRTGLLPVLPDMLKKIMEPLFKKHGQTKLVGKGPNHDGKNYIRNTGFAVSQISEGNVLGSDDLYWFGIPGLSSIPIIGDGFQWGESDIKSGNGWAQSGKGFKVSVWADDTNRKGRHYKVLPNRNGADARGVKKECMFALPFCSSPIKLCTFYRFFANINYDQNERRHHWKGITQFMNFDASDDPDKYFNQPSTWSYMSKSYEELAKNKGVNRDTLKPTTLGKVGAPQRVAVAGPERAVDFNMTNEVQMPLGMKSGALNVMSRGMAYYHRPGNWEEPPNFFNPFWKPKLDPVWQGKEQLPAVGGVLNAASSIIPDGLVEEVITH